MNDERLRKNLVKSLKVMLGFYGLQCAKHGANVIEITKSGSYQERKSNWISRGNHNHLRLSRILASLRILGLENYARALFKCLDNIYVEEARLITPETYGYWKSAAGMNGGNN
jgi:hypothetical protein